MRVFRLLGLVGIAATLSAPAWATAYNAVTDFSNTSNPSGVWSYRDGSGGLLSSQTSSGPSGVGTIWTNGLSFPSASFITANTGATAQTSGTSYYAADAMHLDGQGVGAEVRFTSTTGGTFNISGDFSYGDTSMVTHTVSIVDNNNNTLFSSSLANGQTKDFALASVSLGAGGYLDFISGTDGGSSYAGTNLQAIVGVPEPATFTLLGVGMAGLVVTRRRRGRVHSARLTGG